MNIANEINKQTKLFGYIAEHAGSSRFSALLNKRFKADGKDAMMIPMNIREDDFYFTVSNMKKSHVNGAVIANEYSTQVVGILDDMSMLVRRSGICDMVFKKGETLRGELFGMRVLTEMLKDLRVQKIALLGVGAHAKAFSFLACGFHVSYFHEYPETLLEFAKEVDIENIDINRIAFGMELDMSGYDALLDFSDLPHLTMITKLPAHNFDMKNTHEHSALRERAEALKADYVSYDAMLENLVDAAYKTILD
ncbi:MAG: hypothetical protein RBR59_01745 [Sulfurimonadaceae bacterium]|jgi:shikimate 5-dehydrogenase|nr:hypothetical protein [Sulfurimonadaceae bacterium]